MEKWIENLLTSLVEGVSEIDPQPLISDFIQLLKGDMMKASMKISTFFAQSTLNLRRCDGTISKGCRALVEVSGRAKWLARVKNSAGLCNWGLSVLILVDLFTDHLPGHSPTPSCHNKPPSSSWCKSKMSEIGGGSHHKLHIPTVLSGCGGFRLNHTAYLERVTSLVLSGLVTNLILLFRLFQESD